MEVLIVSKTKMGTKCCVGGLVLKTNQSIRLLKPGAYQPDVDDFEIGQLWDIKFQPRLKLYPPHNEDVIFGQKNYLGTQDNLAQFIQNRMLITWTGSSDVLFDGLLQWRYTGSGFIDPSGKVLPGRSTGYWVSDKNLERYEYYGKVRYKYSDNRNMVFVGFQKATKMIPKGTILRVSLSRPTPSKGFNECWLQLSGWYK